MAKRSSVKRSAAARSEEFAARVANDVSENIDSGENRSQLRDVIRWYAVRNCALHSRLSNVQTQVVVAKFALAVVIELLKRAKVGAASDLACLEQALKILQLDQPADVLLTPARARPQACRSSRP